MGMIRSIRGACGWRDVSALMRVVCGCADRGARAQVTATARARRFESARVNGSCHGRWLGARKVGRPRKVDELTRQRHEARADGTAAEPSPRIAVGAYADSSTGNNGPPSRLGGVAVEVPLQLRY